MSDKLDPRASVTLGPRFYEAYALSKLLALPDGRPNPFRGMEPEEILWLMGEVDELARSMRGTERG